MRSHMLKLISVQKRLSLYGVELVKKFLVQKTILNSEYIYIFPVQVLSKIEQ